MNSRFVPQSVHDKFNVVDWRNALSIAATVHTQDWAEVMDVLSRFVLWRSSITRPGGNKSLVARWIDSELSAVGWREHKFDTRIVVDAVQTDVPTHKVDCFKGRIALEVEWSNKDPFYDRDLNNFRLLFDLRVIDLGVIVTRDDDLSPILRRLRPGTVYGEATTHSGKLMPKIEGGGAGGCPVAVFSICSRAYVDADDPALPPLAPGTGGSDEED